MRVGNLEFSIAADTRTFDTSLRQAQSTADAFASQADRRFQRVQASLEAVAKSTGMPLSQLKALEDRMKNNLSADSASKALDQLTKSANLSADEVKKLEQQMGMTAKGGDVLTSALSKVGSVVAGAFAIDKLLEFKDSIIQTKLQFDALDRTLKTIAGSQEAAAQQMNWLSKTANEMGVDLASSAQGYKTIAAAARGTVMEGRGAQDMFVAVSKASATLGLSADETQGALLALSQMMSKGKVMAEELRGQLGERIPGAFQIAAKSMGMTTGELDAMLQKGGLMADDFLPKFTAELNKAFGAGAEDAAKSGQAAFNRMTNAWNEFKLALADAGVFDSAIKNVNRLSSTVSAYAHVIREFTGTLTGMERVQQLTSKISQYEDPMRLKAAVLAGEIDEGDVADTLAKMKSERSMLLSDNLDMQRAQAAKALQNQQEKAASQAKAMNLASQEATLDSWAKSTDTKTAAWATDMKSRLEAYGKAFRGEISQDAMEVLIGAADDTYQKAITQGGGGVVKANAEAVKILNEARGKALSSQASYMGDKFGAQEAQAATEYQKALDDLNVKLAGFKGTEQAALESGLKFWAAYEYGIKQAQIAFDKWADSMKFWGDIQNQTGALSFNPGQQYQGQLASLQAEQAAAVKAAGDNQEKIAQINQLYALKETDLREKTLGDVAKLDDAYWARRREGLEAMDKFLEQQEANEHARAVYLAQEKDKLAKAEIEARMGYEENFGAYLADRLSLNYGLYKSEIGKQLDLWQKMGDAIIKGLDQVENAFSTVFGAALTDAVTGKFQGMQHYIDSMLSSLKQVLISFLADMAKIAAERYIVIPIVGQIMGTTGSLGLGSISGLNTQGGDGFSLSSLSKYAGYGKDAYNLLSGAGGYSASALGSASSAFNSTMSSTGLTGYQALHAADSASVSSLSSGGVMSALGPTAAAGGLGYLAGGFIRPDNATSSIVGAGAGALAGGIAGMAGLGMLASTGIGALAAIPAALIAGLATPNTTTSSWNSAPGSGQAIMIMGGDIAPSSYGVLKQTTSGMFGSSSTSHQTVFQAADSQMAAQEKTAWESATKGLFDFGTALNLTKDQMKDAASGFVFPMTAVPSGMESQTYRNIANAESEYTLTNLGLLDSIHAVAKDGEATIDTVTRLSTSMASMHQIAQATGFDFDRLTAGMNDVTKADYVSKLSDAAGGMDKVNNALTLLTNHTATNTDRLQVAIKDLSSQAAPQLAALGTSIESFWSAMNSAMSGSIDPAAFARWSEAATFVDQIDTLQKNMSAATLAAHQFDQALSARALSAQGLTYQAQQVQLLAQQEAELAQAREQGYSAAQLARLAEVQAMEVAAQAKAHAEQGDSIRSGLASRIADATDDTMYWLTDALAKKQADYLKIVWDYGYDLANMSNKAYDMEIQKKLTTMAQAKQLTEQAFQYDLKERQLTLAGKADEAGALKLIADQAEQYRNAVASGLGAADLDALLQVQRDELTKYWGNLVADLKSAADAIHKTVAELRGGDQSPLLPSDRYAVIRAQFDADVAKGMTGDRTAISEAQSLASQVLTALSATTTDASVYTSGFNEITGALSRLADVLVGVQQKDAISQADSVYQQAMAQAAAAFSSSFQGSLVQQMATTAMGWSGGIDQLMASSYWPGGNLGWRVDYSMMQGAGDMNAFVNWYRQAYGAGSGSVDWWGALQKWIASDAANPQLAKTALPQDVLNLYQSALAALDNLKKVRGYATGYVTSGPELAMIGERDQEAVIPMQHGRVPVELRGGGNNTALLSELQALRREVAQLRQENREGQIQISKNTGTVSTILRRCEQTPGELTTGVAQ